MLLQAGHQFVQALDRCVPYRDRYHEKPLMCGAARPHTPNPIDILSGAKVQVIEIDNSLGFPLTLTYDTRPLLPSQSPDMRFSAVPPFAFGSLWHSNLHRRLIRNFSQPVYNIQAYRGSNAWVTFIQDGSTFRPDADITDSIFGIYGGMAYRDTSGRSLETYNANSDLATLKRASGDTALSLTYSDANTPVSIAPKPGLLIKVQDARGRMLQFTYEQPAGNLAPRVASMTNPAGAKTSFSYDSIGNLVRITWPDATTRELLYERSDLVWALTGQIDEAGKRIGTYTYDTEGRATRSQGAGGVNSYSVSYQTPPVWEVTETYDAAAGVVWRDHVLKAPTGTELVGPNDTRIAIQSANVQYMPRLTAQSQPAGSGCGPASSSQEFDANANVTRRDDFTGLRTCHAYDMARNLETARVEGLANTQACSAVTPANAVLPPGSRKISTTWHPDWLMPVKVAEPRRLTTNVYNGQPDPFAGNAIASCAPATATLPDGKPIAVLCKTVEQATYDAGGAAGFAATLDTSVPNRVWTYTYNEFGQVLTSRDPRNNTTTNSYYATTTADYTGGDLEKTTGALPALVTRFTKYNPMGQVLQSVDANNVVTDYEYDLRQRLTRQTTAGQSTVYEYLPTGQLKRVTQPDASYVSYEYDPAQRLVAVADNLGNRIEYTLDNSGRQREERVKDPAGVLKRQVSRVFDALGRTQQVTGRE
jgi:YD repeat-containing protein